MISSTSVPFNAFLTFADASSIAFLSASDTLIHSTEKNLKEHGSKISDAEKKAIEDASSSLKEALKGTDNEDVKKKNETLVQASMKLGEAIYKSQAEQDPSTQPGSEQPFDEANPGDQTTNNEDVVDADFEEVDDDKKD